MPMPALRPLVEEWRRPSTLSFERKESEGAGDGGSLSASVDPISACSWESAFSFADDVRSCSLSETDCESSGTCSIGAPANAQRRSAQHESNAAMSAQRDQKRNKSVTLPQGGAIAQWNDETREKRADYSSGPGGCQCRWSLL